MDENPAVSVEILDEGPCQKRLKAVVTAAEVKKELDSNYSQLSKTIQIPGFRKGKIPRSLLERRFASQIEEEVRDDLMNKSFQDEVERLELKILGEPSFDKVEFQLGEPLTFEAAFEVMPAFELGDYKKLPIDSLPAEVSEEDIKRELEALQQQAATHEDVPPGEQQDGDIALCQLHLNDGDETVVEREEVYLKIGNDRVDNIQVEGMGAKILTSKPGDELAFSVDVPEDFPREDLRNRNMQLVLQLNSVKRTKLPEVDDAFAERLGTESVADLREQVKTSLLARRQIHEDHRQEEELLNMLVSRAEMDLPPSMVEDKLKEAQLYERLRLVREGKDQAEIEKALASDEASTGKARDEVKRLFILDRIAEQESLYVLEDEILQRIHQIAAARGEDPAEVAQKYAESGGFASLRDGLLHEKVRRFLRENAEVKGGENDDGSPAASSDAAREADKTVKEN